ncbi:hypothetical protein V6N11_009102, partial [Hibiscus sabdariffa]
TQRIEMLEQKNKEEKKEKRYLESLAVGRRSELRRLSSFVGGLGEPFERRRETSERGEKAC